MPVWSSARSRTECGHASRDAETSQSAKRETLRPAVYRDTILSRSWHLTSARAVGSQPTERTSILTVTGGTTNPGAAPAVVATPTPPVPTRPSGSFARAEGTPVTRLQPGTLVGEYQIPDRIGEGGMGTVYSAVHPIIGKKVAIKVLVGQAGQEQQRHPALRA